MTAPLAQWPPEISQDLLRDGFTEQMEENVLSFQPEVGPPIERKRASRDDDIQTLRMIWTRSEWTLLKAFIRTVRPRKFIRQRPIDDGDGAFMFVGQPRLVRLHPLHAEAEVTVRFLREVLPVASSGMHSAASPALASLE